MGLFKDVVFNQVFFTFCARFERNAVDMFRIDIDDVGKPTKLRIGHNGKGSRPHWFLEKVRSPVLRCFFFVYCF